MTAMEGQPPDRVRIYGFTATPDDCRQPITADTSFHWLSGFIIIFFLRNPESPHFDMVLSDP